MAEAGRKMASVAGRVPATVRGAAAGALSEYTQEVIADPIYIGLENVMRSAGFELTQQNTLKTGGKHWTSHPLNYWGLQPFLAGPLVLLGAIKRTTSSTE